jgi:hypothetical protein
MKLFFLAVVILFFYGCEENNSLFDIYKEWEISTDGKESNYKSFLEEVVVEGISYKNDILTPDLADGRLFEDRNLTRVKIGRHFVYSRNSSFDHKSTIYVEVDPRFLLYTKSYIDEGMRIAQIKSYNRVKRVVEVPKKVVVVQENQDLAPLPKGLLPPRLPDLSIGVSTPNVPDL